MHCKLFSLVALSLGLSATAMAQVTVSTVSIDNQSSYMAVVGPKTMHGTPAAINPGESIQNRLFTHQLFVTRTAKSGLAADSYPFIFDITPNGDTLTLSRETPQMGKTCPLSPQMDTITCKHHVIDNSCHIDVTITNDDVDFYDGTTHFKAKFDSGCKS